MAESKAWFEEWFDSSWYHILYKHRDDLEAARFTRKLAEYLQISPEHKLLDIPCGKGRHSYMFNKMGFDVTGLDLSANSIREASKCSNDRLRFSVHDMRQPFAHKAYDQVLNLFTSFGYFDDDAEDLQALSCMKQALKNDGHMVIDFMNTTKVLLDLVLYEERTEEGITFHIERYKEDKFLIKDIKFVVDGEQKHFQERVKALEEEHFKAYFSNIGLKVKATFGNYELGPYDKRSSDRMIFVLTNAS